MQVFNSYSYEIFSKIQKSHQNGKLLFGTYQVLDLHQRRDGKWNHFVTFQSLHFHKNCFVSFFLLFCYIYWNLKCLTLHFKEKNQYGCQMRGIVKGSSIKQKFFNLNPPGSFWSHPLSSDQITIKIISICLKTKSENEQQSNKVII